MKLLLAGLAVGVVLGGMAVTLLSLIPPPVALFLGGVICAYGLGVMVGMGVRIVSPPTPPPVGHRPDAPAPALPLKAKRAKDVPS